MNSTISIWIAVAVLTVWTFASRTFYVDLYEAMAQADAVSFATVAVLRLMEVGRAWGGLVTVCALIAAILTEAHVRRTASPVLNPE